MERGDPHALRRSNNESASVNARHPGIVLQNAVLSGIPSSCFSFPGLYPWLWDNDKLQHLRHSFCTLATTTIAVPNTPECPEAAHTE